MQDSPACMRLCVFVSSPGGVILLTGDLVREKQPHPPSTPVFCLLDMYGFSKDRKCTKEGEIARYMRELRHPHSCRQEKERAHPTRSSVAAHRKRVMLRDADAACWLLPPTSHRSGP